MKPLLAGLAGALFGAGLILSGMTMPGRVLGFLDVLGHWDGTLAFVMAGAIAVHATTRRLVLRRGAPIYDTCFYEPPSERLDGRLLGGAAVFGVGWGLAGFCPGPALVSAATGGSAALVFTAAMIAGMLVEQAYASVAMRTVSTGTVA